VYGFEYHDNDLWPIKASAAKDPVEALKRFRECINFLCEYVLEQKHKMVFSIEPKPNELRSDTYLATAGHALAMIATLDHPEMVGVNPETAHIKMAGLNPLHEFAQCLEASKLADVHLNGQKPPRYDQGTSFGYETRQSSGGPRPFSSSADSDASGHSARPAHSVADSTSAGPVSSRCDDGERGGSTVARHDRPAKESMTEVAPEPDRVFLAYGRDVATAKEVTCFLKRIGLCPVLLKDQPNAGQTIIKKLERHSDVGYAVVLLTPDDEGRLTGSGRNLSPRARQNVVFELGLFVGRLGRARVCVLRKGDIELPSDMAGVLYVNLDDGADWKYELARELKHAGLQIDLNMLLNPSP
jgi:predicted nucleotide-binding protein